jgi:hypothetical protein
MRVRLLAEMKDGQTSVSSVHNSMVYHEAGVLEERRINRP